MSSFLTLFSPSLIRPSDEMNSVYMKSAPLILQMLRKEGSVISSMGARKRGRSPSDMFPIVKIELFDEMNTNEQVSELTAERDSASPVNRHF